MKKKATKKESPKIALNIDPYMPAEIVANLSNALAGGSPFILISHRDGVVLLDRHDIKTRVQFLGLLEVVKGDKD